MSRHRRLLASLTSLALALPLGLGLGLGAITAAAADEPPPEPDLSLADGTYWERAGRVPGLGAGGRPQLRREPDRDGDDP